MTFNLDDYEEIPDPAFWHVDSKRYRHKVTGVELSITHSERYGIAPVIRMKQEDYNNGT